MVLKQFHGTQAMFKGSKMFSPMLYCTLTLIAKFFYADISDNNIEQKLGQSWAIDLPKYGQSLEISSAMLVLVLVRHGTKTVPWDSSHVQKV